MPGMPFEMTIEAGKIREFARAVRSTDHDNLGPNPVSPPTFLMTGAWWQTDESSAFAGMDRDLRCVLHGEQEFTFYGEPPSAGDTLIGEARIDRTYEKAGKRGGSMTFTDVVTSYTDPDGRLVAEVRSTIISTEHAPTKES